MLATIVSASPNAVQVFALIAVIIFLILAIYDFAHRAIPQAIGYVAFAFLAAAIIFLV